MNCTGHMTDSCADALEQCRQTLTQRFLDYIYELLDSFWSRDESCVMECNAIMLGMLIKQMLSFGLEVPRPISGYSAQEKSLLQLYEFCNELESPSWRLGYTTFNHTCCFSTKTEPWLITMSNVDICHGVRFEDFKPGTSKKVTSEELIAKWRRKGRDEKRKRSNDDLFRG